jgi:hypothetical protein
MTVAFVFLCRSPTEAWLSRIDALTGADEKLVVVDDETSLPDFVKNFSSVRVFQVKSDEARDAGYHDTSFPFDPKDVMAWEKALWMHKKGYFQTSHVWFFEDDVLVPACDTVQKINARIPSADLLTASHEPEAEDSDWHYWEKLKPTTKLSSPRFHSMGCARRVSSRLLAALHAWVEKYKTLEFHEIIFNTLAHQEGMEIVTPPELETIVYRREWKDEEFSRDKLFHPVKDMDEQARVWKLCANARRSSQ